MWREATQPSVRRVRSTRTSCSNSRPYVTLKSAVVSSRTESQVVRAELRDLPCSSEPRERDGWQTTAGKDDGHSIWPTVQQGRGEVASIGRIVDEMEIIEDQDGAAEANGGEVLKEGIDNLLPTRSARPSAVQQVLCRCPKVGDCSRTAATRWWRSATQSRSSASRRYQIVRCRVRREKSASKVVLP